MFNWVNFPKKAGEKRAFENNKTGLKQTKLVLLERKLGTYFFLLLFYRWCVFIFRWFDLSIADNMFEIIKIPKKQAKFKKKFKKKEEVEEEQYSQHCMYRCGVNCS